MIALHCSEHKPIEKHPHYVCHLYIQLSREKLKTQWLQQANDLIIPAAIPQGPRQLIDKTLRLPLYLLLRLQFSLWLIKTFSQQRQVNAINTKKAKS